MRAIVIKVVGWALLGFVFLQNSAIADADIWKTLEAGGQIVLMRHGLTTPGAGDPPGMRLDDCSTQRNLTDAGRRHAREVGEAFRTRNVAVERVLTSPWCRCRETAQLAFGDIAEVSQPLGNLFGRHENEASQVKALRALVANWRGKGNLVLVSHGSTILALTGVSPDTAEMVIVTPAVTGDFTVAGRLIAHRQ